MSECVNPWVYIWIFIMHILAFITALAVNDAVQYALKNTNGGNDIQGLRFWYAALSFFLLIGIAYIIIHIYPELLGKGV